MNLLQQHYENACRENADLKRELAEARLAKDAVWNAIADSTVRDGNGDIIDVDVDILNEMLEPLKEAAGGGSE